jgi:hypothetical protein
VHLLPGDADPATGDVLCAIYPGWLPGLGRRPWLTGDSLPADRALCAGCGEKYRNLERAGRLLVTPPAEQLTLDI